MQNNCPITGPKCDICDCSGRACQSRFPGLKVEWPELKGVSGTEAKAIIERDNSHVTAIVYPVGVYFPSISCCNRVILYVPPENCPNGPVQNSPIIG